MTRFRNYFFGDNANIISDREFQALLLANVLPILGSGLVSPILNSLIGPFGTSAANIGLIISVFTAPSILIIPLAGILSDWYGRKPVLVASIALFGLAGLAIVLTTDFQVVLILRLLQGIGFGGTMPIITASIGDLYTKSEEATAQGLRIAGSGFAATVFPLISGLLVVIAWQYPFFLYAIAIPIAFLVARWFNEPSAAADTAQDTTKKSVKAEFLTILALIKQRRVFVLILARGFPTFVWIAFLTYNSLVVVRIIGGETAQSGVLVALGSLAFGTAASQAGRLAERFKDKFYPILGANICLSAGFIIFLFAPILLIGAISIAIAGLGFGVALSLYRSLITDLTNDSHRGSIVSVSEAFGRVVATTTPILTGIIIAVGSPRIGVESAVQVAGTSAALLAGGGGIICLLIIRSSPPVQ